MPALPEPLAAARLRPGPASFIVEEEAAYAASGSGEHCYLQIEKEGLTTDHVAEAIAKACGAPLRSVGYAGRKDRWGITRQWFSVHAREAPTQEGIDGHLPRSGRATILSSTRHGNKLRLGHLAGNRFRLGLAGIDAAATAGITAGLARLVHEGIPNPFGAQRFGHAGATLRLARAWGADQAETAVAWAIDPDGRWRWGDPLPEGFRTGPEGRVLGALRRGADARGALRAAGDQLLHLVASAGQSAVFNAILDARSRAGLTHTVRVGDIASTARGGMFVVCEADLADAQARAAPGRLEIVLTAPLPPCERLQPGPLVAAEERAWAAPSEVDWSWFDAGRPLASPGERRPLLIRFREAPSLVPGEGDGAELSLSLPPGSYATEVLACLGISVPEDRRGEPPPAENAPEGAPAR